MKVVPFIADSAAGALAQIHQQLGPEAVVLNVKPAETRGWMRLWPRSQRIEVLACVEDRPRHMGIGPVLAAPVFSEPEEAAPESVWNRATKAITWDSIARLESLGLLKEASKVLQSKLLERFGPAAPSSSERERSCLHDVLTAVWRTPPPLLSKDGHPHVFIGPPGVGKTTLLCKWLVQNMLTRTTPARLWRLDGGSANTGELLNLYGEMFGLSVARTWEKPDVGDELLLVDLPGVDANDAVGLQALEERLGSLGACRPHLVLNAAYETPILLTQLKSFARFNPEDVSFTHVDEDRRSGKLWNFVFGTNCSLRFLSAGQKIPGGLSDACPELLLPN
jgi:flagellar biosynthesis GTPase FlhF